MGRASQPTICPGSSSSTTRPGDTVATARRPGPHRDGLGLGSSSPRRSSGHHAARSLSRPIWAPERASRSAAASMTFGQAR